MSEYTIRIVFLLGVVMAVTGGVGLIYALTHWRDFQAQFREGRTDDPGHATDSFASIWIVNGFLHFGMLLVVLGGLGLIYYGIN